MGIEDAAEQNDFAERGAAGLDGFDERERADKRVIGHAQRFDEPRGIAALEGVAIFVDDAVKLVGPGDNFLQLFRHEAERGAVEPRGLAGQRDGGGWEEVNHGANSMP